MDNNTDNIELLAPAGSYESLHAAINAGCDAIYFGVEGFNMRANTSKKFTLDDLANIAKICHEATIKCYLALNTLVYDANLEEMKLAIDAVKANDIDAVISFDHSVLNYAKEVGVEVHISTQHSISNIEAVKYFTQWSDRVVLARELSLEQIKHITEQIIEQDIRGPKGRLMEIEIFIHGAMCVAVSGRCGMSLYMYDTSANCGKCSQPCRRSYTVTDDSTGKKMRIENEFVMSPEDLCTIGMLDEIVASGVVSLKIEGRGRAPEYVDQVVRSYREALTAIETNEFSQEKVNEWNEQLGTVFNRGMSEGFYRGKAYSYWSEGAHSKATEKRELVGTVEHFYPKPSIAEVRVHASTIEDGEKCIFTGTTTGILRATAKDMQIDEKIVTDAKQGDIITFIVPDRVRKGDKLYKLIPAGPRTH